MKKTIFLMIVAVMVLALTGIAMAGTEAGDKELQVQGSVSNTTNSETDDSTSTSTIQLSFNYFFTPNFSIGGTYRGSSTYTEYEGDYTDDSTTTQNFLLLRGDGYLGGATSKFMPYIGGHVGQISFTIESGDYEESDTVSTYGFHGGVKIFAGENISWNLELDRTTYTYEPDEGDDIEVYVDSFFAGFSYYF